MANENSKTKATLNKKSIAAIADQVESRLRGNGQGSVTTEKGEAKGGHGSKGTFFWGAASGLALAVAAPLLGRQARPAMRGAIKGGILASRYVQRVASGVKEDVQDLSAEAAAELDEEETPRAEEGPTKRKKGPSGQPN
jgi:hypothetical protein